MTFTSLPHSGPRRLTIATILALACGAVLSACGSTNSSGASSQSAAAGSGTSASASTAPARLLIICSLSGSLAVAGGAILDGAKAAAKVLNAEGGVAGHKVIITPVDDAGNGVTAVSKAEQAIASGTNYTSAYGGCFGQDALPLATIFGRTHIVDFAPVPDNYVAPPKYPNMFIGGTLISTPEIAVAAAMKAKGITKFAIVSGNDTTAVLLTQALQAAAKKSGMTVSATEQVPDTAVDATPQVSAALASHPQAIAITGYTPVVGPILKSRATLSPSLPVYGDAYVGAANVAALTTDLKGLYEVTFPFLEDGNPAQRTPAWRAFISADHVYNPKPLVSTYADITGYDWVMAVAGGIRKAGSVTGQAVANALGSVSLSADAPGFVGNFPLFSPTVHAWRLTSNDYQALPAAPWKDGLLAPAA